MEHEVRQISDEGRREIAKELREQFFCCQYAEEFTEGLYGLLWAMLTDSYSRWRTTGDMFNETGESCDL